MTDQDYIENTNAVFARIEAQIDAWLEDGTVDIDASRTGGLLELHFQDRSVVVVNTQPPLREIWLAAPSGGFHYRYRDGAWRDTRDGGEFFAALSGCLSERAGLRLEVR